MKKLLFLAWLLINTVASFAQLSKEQNEIKDIFFDFLNFYEKNEEKFNGFQLYKGSGTDNRAPYHINWEGVEAYFNFLKQEVPFVGDVYIEQERKAFINVDSNFIVYQDDDIPIGFEYDRWTNAQEEPKGVIAYLKSPKNTIEVNIDGDKAVLLIGSRDFGDENPNALLWQYVPFEKENNKWKMANNLHFISE